jgi:hypothetical protein
MKIRKEKRDKTNFKKSGRRESGKEPSGLCVGRVVSVGETLENR